MDDSNNESLPLLPDSNISLPSNNYSSNFTRPNHWLDDDGTTDWLFITSFIWLIIATTFCLVLFFTNRKVRKNKSSLLSLNLLFSVIVNEIIRSITLIYHDAIGNPTHFTFGLHYCRFSILAWSFSFTLQTFSVVLVTIDSCFQTFSSPKYNEYLSSKRIFWVLISCPAALAVVTTTLLILSVSPQVGRIITIGSQQFCFLNIPFTVIRSWLTAYSLITVVIPGTVSFVISICLMVRMCRHLSSYGVFVSDGPAMRDGATRMKQIVIATFVMNFLFVAFSGPYAWSRLFLKYSLLEESKIAFRVYWCLLPLVWLSLQPELLAVVTSTLWRCWYHGPRETLSSCLDTMRGVEGKGASDIREYNVENLAEPFEQVPI